MSNVDFFILIISSLSIVLVYLYLNFFRNSILIKKVKNCFSEYVEGSDVDYEEFYSLGVACDYVLNNKEKQVAVVSFGYGIVLYSHIYLACKVGNSEDVGEGCYVKSGSLIASKIKYMGNKVLHFEDFHFDNDLLDDVECVQVSNENLTFFVKVNSFLSNNDGRKVKVLHDLLEIKLRS